MVVLLLCHVLARKLHFCKKDKAKFDNLALSYLVHHLMKFMIYVWNGNIITADLLVWYFWWCLYAGGACMMAVPVIVVPVLRAVPCLVAGNALSGCWQCLVWLPAVPCLVASSAPSGRHRCPSGGHRCPSGGCRCLSGRCQCPSGGCQCPSGGHRWTSNIS